MRLRSSPAGANEARTAEPLPADQRAAASWNAAFTAPALITTTSAPRAVSAVKPNAATIAAMKRVAMAVLPQ